ncbi:unnamed protein product [Adineta ricciae]|uniref:DAGKc domain-containing protein n=1 Tax=Adineta ricciae TaxID=249248 RepID=A0A814TEF3_ADIRI|nr:unnamed protein product [Adineta ricciae]
MSAHARRRRAAAPPATIKVAFGGDDENQDNERRTNQEFLEENDNLRLNSDQDRNRYDANVDATYERAFFAIQNKTVEVIFANNVLSWADVTGEPVGNEIHRRPSPDPNDQNSINLNDVFGITPIHSHSNWSMNVNENIAGTVISTSNSISGPMNASSTPLSQNSVLRGFQLHSYQTLTDNVLQEILVVFQSDDPNLIERWFHLLSKIIIALTPPKNIFVLCNPYAGPRHSRHVYNTKIKPMLETRRYKITYMEISDQFSADEALQNFEDGFDSIDSLVIIGGDGSVINVINALISYLAKEYRTRLDIRADLPTIPFPICIVPDGTTNIISHTLHGNIDHCTPILHLIYNHTMKIDMSAVFDVDYKFVTANFGAAAGYPANALKYFPRYSLHSPKTVIKKSFAKAASKKYLQPFQMEIRYIAAPQTNSMITRCYRGCPLCTPTVVEKSDDQVKAFDNTHMQDISRRKRSITSNNENNHRISSAGRRSFNLQYDEEKNWKVMQNTLLEAAVFTNANLWSFAPQGLSKFGHIADGFLDLVVIDAVNRKEFLRYVKRNGNSKNQYDLSFTNIIKVKEVEIELKFINDIYNNDMRNTDNPYDSTPSDNSSNEDTSDNENKLNHLQRHKPHPPSEPISDDIRRRRRRGHQQLNQQSHEPTRHDLQASTSVDASVLHFRNRQFQQSESEMDSPQIDQYDSTKTRRRSGIFQSLKLKKNKIPLPRPSSAQREETDDDKQQRKNRKTTGGTLRPARSLLSLFSAGNLPTGKTDKLPNNAANNSSSANSNRKLSVISRSASVDNPSTSEINDSLRNKNKPCLWNLDFTPYNSPIIRIKCFCRYLTVYGTNLDPDTRVKEMTYSCF